MTENEIAEAARWAHALLTGLVAHPTEFPTEFLTDLAEVTREIQQRSEMELLYRAIF